MPKQIDHDQRRRELVEASWEVIARDGLEGVTLRKVADAADCTTGRIAHYFDGRDALILSALQTAYSDAATRMEEATNAEQDAKERLRRVVHEGLPLDARRLKEWKVWLVFWSAAASNEMLSRENARRYADWQKWLKRLISDIAGPENATERALELVSMIDGLGIRATLIPTAANRRVVRDAVDRWIGKL